MVTRAKRNSDDMPYINLDIDSFSRNSSYTQDDVRRYLQENINNLNTATSQTDEVDENASERDAKGDMLRNKRDTFARQNAEAELALFEKNPEAYTTLFALKKNTEHEIYNRNPDDENNRDADKTKAKICEDENGNLFLAVEIMKPTDVSFQIHDGKLSFDPKGMSPDRLKEMISYLERQGLLSFVNLDDIKLENADEDTQEMFDQAKDEMDEDRSKDDEQIVTSEGINGEEDSLTVDEAQNDNREAEQNTDDLPFKENEDKSDGKSEYDSAIGAVTKWMDKNKRRNLSYFVSHEKGYTVFTTFDKENSDNMDLDNVIDKKTKDIKVRHECKVYVKQGNNGKVEISFSTPNGKPLSPAYADLIMDAHKDAGHKRVKFGKMSDDNEAAIRIACGRAMIVPVGLKLSQTKFDKMIDASEAKNGKNNPKVLKYKRDLAMQFAYQLQQKGIDWTDEKNKNNVDCRCIRGAIGAYDYSPFRDLWEDFGLRGKYENIIRDSASGNPNGAAAAIGATKAVSKLFAAYSEAIDSSKNPNGTLDYLVSDQCHSLTATEKQQFKNIIAGMEKTEIRDIPPKAAIKLFEIMQQTQEKRAVRKIEDEYQRLVHDSFYKGNATRDAVKPYLEEATADIENVKSELAEYGLPQIGVIRMGSPKYDFSNLQRQMKAAKQNNNSGNAANNQTAINAYRNRNQTTYH